MNRTPNDYSSAARLYEGRKDKVLGRKIRTTAWMKHDPKRDCFVLSEVLSKYEFVKGSGFSRYKALPKEQWHLRPYAEIYRDRIVVLREVHNNCIEAMGIRNDRSKTVKFSGRTWTHFRMEQYKRVTIDQINGDAPITLMGGKLSAAVPPMKRVVNNDLRIEMNRMIRKIRQLLTVRVKLGAFDGLTHGDLIAHAEKNNYGSKWQLYQKPEEFLKLLQAVTEDDLTTFYPILWMSDRAWYIERKDTSFINGRNVVQLYENFINSMRERIRRELGVVKYVEVAASDAGADCASNEAQAAG